MVFFTCAQMNVAPPGIYESDIEVQSLLALGSSSGHYWGFASGMGRDELVQHSCPFALGPVRRIWDYLLYMLSRDSKQTQLVLKLSN